MLALISFFVVILLSILIIRVAAVALELTGLSPDIAGFQALSAFTGAGFTTKESETILKQSSRRKIIMALMLGGSAGLTTSITSLILAFNNKDTTDVLVIFAVLFVGLITIMIFMRSKFVEHAMKHVIIDVLERFTHLDVIDYHEILGLGKGFVVSEIFIEDDSWMLGKELKDLKLDREGTLILSIERKEGRRKHFMGAPNGKTVIEHGDKIICYGRPEAIKSLSSRKADIGDKEHRAQIAKLKKVEAKT
ncbi:MAG: TrkA C-terminal domain-containing protein [Candidatus Melainabacteria bacterium]|nr:TrkA C-terminal domain-containing protein [Candidatus Melainabacteria bacterium]